MNPMLLSAPNLDARLERVRDEVAGLSRADRLIAEAQKRMAEADLSGLRTRENAAIAGLPMHELTLHFDAEFAARHTTAPGPARTLAEAYVVGLLVTETGEALQDLGNGLRFGLDTPHSADLPETARDHLVHEFGDVLAAIEFACLHGLFDRAGIEAARDRKLAKLCDPANRDHLGRPLAPQPIALGTDALPCTLDGWSEKPGRLALQLRDNGALYGFDVSEPLAARLLAGILAAFPQLAPQPEAVPSRTTLVTSRRDASVATFVFERNGEPFDLDLDWETARQVRTEIDARFPDASR